MHEKSKRLVELLEKLRRSKSKEDREALIKEMLREAHTIKGSSSLTGFPRLSQIAHWLETVLEYILSGDIDLNEESTSLLEELVRAINALAISIEHSGKEEGVPTDYLIARATMLIKRARGSKPIFREVQPAVTPKEIKIKLRPRDKDSLIRLLGTLSGLGEITEIEPPDIEDIISREENPPEEVRLTLKTRNPEEVLAHLPDNAEVENKMEIAEEPKKYLVGVLFKEDAPLKEARAVLLVKTLEKIGEVISAIPPLEKLEHEGLDGREFKVVIESKKAPEEIKRRIISHPDIESVEIKEVATIDIEGEYQEKTQETRRTAPVRIRKEDYLKVEKSKFDRLLTLVEDLIAVQGWIKDLSESNPSKELRELVSKLEDTVFNIRKVVFELRTLPLKELVQGFGPFVEKLGEEHGKKVKVVVEGIDVKIDRKIAEILWEALIHILTNAIIHGIETPKERREKRKPETGIVRISISQKSDYVEIAVSDDGRGINIEEIKRRALERGLVDRAELERMGDEEALYLIFLPGMSTSEDISSESGRGIGLNVVREIIRSHGGRILVESSPNLGTTFTIQVPFEMSILPLYIAEVSGELYAVPAYGVEKIAEFSRENVRRVGVPLVVVEGELLPALFLHDFTEIPSIPGEHLEGLVVNLSSGRMVILADKIAGKREAVVRSLKTALLGKNLPDIFLGVTIIGGNKIVPVVDCTSFLEKYSRTSAR